MRTQKKVNNEEEKSKQKRFKREKQLLHAHTESIVSNSFRLLFLFIYLHFTWERGCVTLLFHALKSEAKQRHIRSVLFFFILPFLFWLPLFFALTPPPLSHSLCKQNVRWIYNKRWKFIRYSTDFRVQLLWILFRFFGSSSLLIVCVCICVYKQMYFVFFMV